MRNQHTRARFQSVVSLAVCLGLLTGLLPAPARPAADAAALRSDVHLTPDPQRASARYLPLIVRSLALAEYDLPPLPPGFAEFGGWASGVLGGWPQAPNGSLLPGWHLLSVPVQPADTAPGAVLASIAGSYRLAYAYDGCDAADPWKVYDPTAPAFGDLTAIDPRIGFWVAVTSTATLTVTGAPPGPTPIRLCRGWNLIGYPLAKPLPVLTALASIAGSFTRVFAYNPADPADPWSLFDVAVPGWVNDLQMMAPEWGYWVLATKDVTLTIVEPTPTPTPTSTATATPTRTPTPTATPTRVPGRPPVVSLTSPAEQSEITEQAELTGTVRDPDGDLTGYQLQYRQLPGLAWTTFATGTLPVNNAALGRFDPTLLLNGMYEVRVVATDEEGNETTAGTTIYVAGAQKVGVVRLAFTDVDVPLLGIPIQVQRIYDSRMKTQGDFGFGWTMDVHQGSYVHNRTPGAGWQINPGSGFPPLPCQEVAETLSHFTEVRLSEEEAYHFRLDLVNPSATLGGCFAEAAFSFLDGWLPGATLTILGNRDVLYRNGETQVLDVNTLQPYNPRQARLTTVDGRILDLDAQYGITRIQDPNGNALTIAANAISHSKGQSITFTRDAQGRITQITDPLAHTVQYAYDAAGDLTRVTNQVGEATRYTYSAAVPHHLTAITNPDGTEITQFQYDADGRLIAACDAADACTALTHDLAARTQTVVDPTGRREVHTYDSRGNITAITDGLGNVTTFAYDARGNMTRLTDAAGGVTAMTYDARRNLTSVVGPHAADQPAADFTTAYSYNSRGQTTAVQYPTGARINLAYDAAGNLTQVRDGAGALVFATTYGADGAITSESSLFATTTFVNDADGNPVEMTDAFGSKLTMTYNAAGQLTGFTDHRGETSAIQYDGLGREASEDYGEGTTLAYTYDHGMDWGQVTASTFGTLERTFAPNGDLAAWTLPNGYTESYTYDAAGRVLQETGPAGRVTRYAYDAAGRADQVTLPSGAAFDLTRDSLGRVTGRTDPLGATEAVTYTTDGRLGASTDGRGNTWNYSYTLTTTQITDPLGRVTTLVNSEYGLPLETIYPDGATSSVTYLTASPLSDAQSYPTAFTDEQGRPRRFTYNAYGQLATAQALGGATYTYTYAQSQLIAVQEPAGETIGLGYDAQDRLQTITYGDGTTRTLTYNDMSDQLAGVTFSSGITLAFGYDVTGRLTTQRSSAGEQTAFTWNADGNLTAVQDGAGTAHYAYDLSGNLARMTTGDGAVITYGRDVLGRVITVTVQAAADGTAYVTTYAYDAGHNPVKIVDPLGGVTALTYDAANRLVERTLPNGVKSAFAYDVRDQVTLVTHRKADGALLASLAYQRAATGEPTRITREDGSYVLLGYDAAGRLSSEAYHDAAGVLAETISYTYNAAGDRLTRSSAAGDLAYTYAPGHKLLAATGTAGAEAYGHDVDGRLTSVARDGKSWRLEYDPHDQLTAAVDLTGGTRTDYTYDGLGQRVAAADAGGTRRYIMAPASGVGLESVHLVASPAGALVTGYAYAGELPLLRFGAGGPAYYLTDGMGSVIALADAAGDAVARFAYDGFGNLRSATGAGAAPPAGAGGDFRFHGAWLEGATGLYHLGARDYDPRTGRFLSRDGGAGDLFRPETLHPYVFANNNPQLYGDPTGEEFSVMGLTVSISVGNMMRSMQMVAVQGAMQYARQRVIQAVQDFFFGRLLSSLMPRQLFKALDEFEKQGQRGVGNIFSGMVERIVCGAVDVGGMLDWFWFAPRISTDGEPVTNGLNCADRRIGHQDEKLKGLFISLPTGRKSLGEISNPDFVIKESPLVTSGSPQAILKKKRPTGQFLVSSAPNPPKAWLVGDFKIALSQAYHDYYYPGDREKQFTMMTNYARKYGRHVVAIVGWKGATAGQKHALRKKAAQNYVFLVMYSVLRR
jgi:RHS repeat-associated protein